MSNNVAHGYVVPLSHRMRGAQFPFAAFVRYPACCPYQLLESHGGKELVDPTAVALLRKRLLCFIIIFLILELLPTSLSGAAGQDYDAWTVEHFRLAREAERQSDFAKAAENYRLIISRNPRFAGAYLNLGVIYHQQRRYPEAVKVLKTAVTLDPHLLGAQLFLGIDEYLSEDFKSALFHLQQALKLKPTDRQAGFYLGLTYIALRAPLQAARALRKTAEYYPDDVEINYELGLAYLEAVKEESARLNEMSTKSALCHWALGIAANEKNNQVGVVTEYMKALALDPNLADLYWELTIMLGHLGIPELAAAALQRYKGLRPDQKVAESPAKEMLEQTRAEEKAPTGSKDSFLQLWKKIPPPRYDPSIPAVADSFLNQALKENLASADGTTLKAALQLYLQGDYQGAARTIADSRTQGISWPVAYLWASAYQRASEFDRAEHVLEDHLLPYMHLPSVSLLAIEIHRRLAFRTFNQVIGDHPNSYFARMLLAKSHAAAGRNSEALSAFQEALKMAPDQLGIHLAIGELYESQLHWNPAIEEFKAELALDPANAMALAHLGHALTEAREPDQAIPVLDNLLKTNPADGQAWSDFGKDWEAKGEKEKAIDAYQRALLHDPSQIDLHYRLFQLYGKLGQQDRAQKELATFKEGEARKHSRYQQGMAERRTTE
jgi:tetratricopeptide (TPR) repeat protein